MCSSDLLAAVAHAATVDFSNFPTSGGNANPDSVTSGGATFNGDTLVVANPTAPPFDKLGTAISNNTTYLMVNPSGVTMTLGGYGTTSAPAPFDLTSIDLNRVFFDDLAGNAAGLPNALIVNVTGTTVSGSTVRTNIRVDGSKNFQTFSLPSNFEIGRAHV